MAELYRKLYHKLLTQTDNKYTLIITGARQTGKTTLLHQLGSAMQEAGSSIVYLSLEDPAVLSRLNLHPENILEFMLLSTEGRTVLLLDEVQYLNDPSNFLKLLYDKYAGRLKVIATGSSAFYMDTRFRDSLAGRKLLFELFTLDFDEFLLFRTGSALMNRELDAIRENPNYRSAVREELASHFREYLTWGGYPAVVLEPDTENKTLLLRELTGSYLKRDVFEAGIRNHDKFHHLTLILAQQVGSLVNRNELSRVLGVSGTAIESYMHALETCFHISLVRPFARNLRKELTKMPKVFFHDSGFRNALIHSLGPITGRPDQGALAENYAFIRLRALYGTESIRYWRTADGQEVDLVVHHPSVEGFAIEVKSDSRRFNPTRYKKFTTTYPEYPLHCRTLVAKGNDDALMAL